MSAHFSSPEEKQERKSKAYRASIMTAIILAVLTVIEYFVALVTGSAIIMMLIGLLKAYFVVVTFMHVARLWLPEGEH